MKLKRLAHFCTRLPVVLESIAVVIFAVAKRHIADSTTIVITYTPLAKRTNKIVVVIALCFNHWHINRYETIVVLRFDLVLGKLWNHKFRLV